VVNSLQSLNFEFTVEPEGVHIKCTHMRIKTWGKKKKKELEVLVSAIVPTPEMHAMRRERLKPTELLKVGEKYQMTFNKVSFVAYVNKMEEQAAAYIRNAKLNDEKVRLKTLTSTGS